jgi:hypothetical protein
MFNIYNNPWGGFLEDNPDILYGGFLNNASQGQGRNFWDYWQSQFGNQYNKYLGQLGSTALGGNAPTMNFSDYLGNFNFGKQWGNLSPGQRGEYQAPRVRWNW